MTIITRVYVGLAFIILGSAATFISIATMIYRVVYEDEDLTVLSIANIFTTSGLTLMFSAFSMGLYRVDALTSHRGRQVVDGSENPEQERIKRVQLLHWLRIFEPVFSWSWKLATLIYLILCVVLGFSLNITMEFSAFIMGIFMYLMAFLSSFLAPSIIRSLEIIAGSATNGDIPMS